MSRFLVSTHYLYHHYHFIKAAQTTMKTNFLLRKNKQTAHLNISLDIVCDVFVRKIFSYFYVVQVALYCTIDSFNIKYFLRNYKFTVFL